MVLHRIAWLQLGISFFFLFLCVIALVPLILLPLPLFYKWFLRELFRIRFSSGLWLCFQAVTSEGLSIGSYRVKAGGMH